MVRFETTRPNCRPAGCTTFSNKKSRAELIIQGRKHMNPQHWPILVDQDFAEAWRQVLPFMNSTPECGYAIWRAVSHIIDKNIPGSFVECGAWRGGSAMLIALALLKRNAVRDIFLFDRFDGVSPPTDEDRKWHDPLNTNYLHGMYSEDLAPLANAQMSLREIRENLLSTGIDARLTHFVVGNVEETAARTQTLGIALLRLDTYCYSSTKHGLEALYPRVVEGGILIANDHGHWGSARKPVDEYFLGARSNGSLPMFWPIDYTARGSIKTYPAEEVEIARYDYLPPGMIDPQLSRLFPYAEAVNPWAIHWPFLRPAVPHVFRADSRNKDGVPIGNATYEEAVCIHTIATQFAGLRGLEIGTHFGWTSAHLHAAGLRLDLVDPAFSKQDRIAEIREVLDAISNDMPYQIWPGFSPESISEIYAQSSEPWSLVFIDGDHEGEAPLRDAEAVIKYCAKDAVVIFHDMTSPFVSAGLSVFKAAGWQVGLYNTMQVLGIAWRGNVLVPRHLADPNTLALFQPHLEQFESL